MSDPNGQSTNGADSHNDDAAVRADLSLSAGPYSTIMAGPLTGRTVKAGARLGLHMVNLRQLSPKLVRPTSKTE